MRSTLFLALAFGLLAVACGSSSATGPSLDGGDGGGCGAPLPLHCASSGCYGGETSAECIDGAWTCPPESEIACPVDSGNGGDDGGSNDGGISGDAGFDCDGITCNATTQYCDIRGGGVHLLDAGSNTSIQCLTLPTMPCEAGSGCACIPNACGCTDEGGAIKNECLYP
jgi:hypothetical protein